MVVLYDSLSRQKVALSPRIPGHVRIYTCGVTPYNQSHLGHARPAVMWDAMRRYLRRRGYVVTFVQNFTDIDDRIIREAAATGTSPDLLARHYIEDYQQSMETLGVMPADFAPRVTDNIGSIVAYIEALVTKGMAYPTAHGVYFRVLRDEDYGSLSGRKVEDMRDGVRVDVDETKEYPGDFALWKSATAGEPSWPSPWGDGRPGWHIECSAMADRYLDGPFDVHGGGMDLLFPHHENERAQSRAYLGVEPVSIWMHNGLITRQGVKMSKSLNNGTALADVLAAYEGAVVRSYLLSTHYRNPLEYHENHLTAWATGLNRVMRLWEEVKTATSATEPPCTSALEHLVSFEDRLLDALDDDFDTPRAFAEIFDMVTATYRAIAEGHDQSARGLARRNLDLANQVFGFLPAGSSRDDFAWAQSLLERRSQARRERDFALADSLRDVLIHRGFEVLDGPDGTRVHRLLQSQEEYGNEPTTPA